MIFQLPRMLKMDQVKLGILCIALLTSTFQGNAKDGDSPIDSLKKKLVISRGEDTMSTLDALAEAYYSINPDSTLYFTQQLWHQAEENDLVYWKGRAQRRFTWYYCYMRQIHDSVLYHGNLAFRFLTQAGMPRQALDIRLWQATSYKDKGLHEAALQRFMKILPQADSLNALSTKVHILCEIAITFNWRKDSVNAVKYIDMAKQIVDDTPLAEDKPRVYNDMGIIYETVGRMEESVEVLKQILPLRKGRAKSITINNIARTYVALETYDSALKYLKMGAALRQQLDVPIHSAYAYKEYASMYLGLKQYRTALDYAQKVYKIGVAYDHTGHVEDGLRSMRDACIGMEEYEKSTEYALAYTNFLQSQYDKEREGLIQDMESKYQTALKDKEIENLEAKRLVDAQEKIILQRTVIFISILALLTLYLLWSVRKKQKVDKQLAQAQLSLRDKELKIKEQKLAQFASLIKEKNLILEQLEEQISNLEFNGKQQQFDDINKLMQSIILTEEDWQEFKIIFENVHNQFFAKLKENHPSLTTAEIRILALMKLKLSNKEMAHMLGIASDSVTRTKHRIKKKLNIADAKELAGFAESL